MEKRKLAHTIRLGNILAIIWANDSSQNGVWFKVELTRFRRDEWPIAVKVLDMAYTWIWERQGATSTDEGQR